MVSVSAETRFAQGGTYYVYVGGLSNWNGGGSGSYPGGEDIFVAKHDALTGSQLWVKQFGSTSGDMSYDLAVDSSGRVGIGMTSPNESLTVNGVLSIAESASSPAASSGG